MNTYTNKVKVTTKHNNKFETLLLVSKSLRWTTDDLDLVFRGH